MSGSLQLYSPKPRRRKIGPEACLQMTVVEHLRLRGVPGLLFFHPCNEGKRSESAALILKRMGLLPGIADLVIDAPGQPLSFLELKAKGEKQSIDQVLFGEYCNSTGRRYAVADGIDAALAILVEWGSIMPRAQIGRAEFRRERAA